MINGLKPYPAMKESGVPWLGQVPEHWDVGRLKRICKFAYGDALSSDVRTFGDVPVLGSNGRVGSHTVTNTIAPCIVIGRKGSFGKITYSDEPVFAIDTTFFVDRRFTDADIRWLSYLLGWLQLDEISKDSAIPGLDREDAYKSVVIVPSMDEQHSIVRFLDHADWLIRRYIAAKRKLIKLLEEQKQAIIHHAVTRGLDPSVALKPSGVRWLGEVPEHWAVRRGKYYFREVDERSRDGTEELMSVSHKTGVTPRSEKNITMFMAESYVGHKLCRPDDIVVNTMWGWMAAVGVAKKVGIVSPSYGVYRARRTDEFRSQYLDLLLRTEVYRSEYVRSSRGITTSRLRLYPEDFLQISFVRPPLDEQDAILHSVESETSELNRAIGAANHEVTLFQEYRTRLIADVVTGKLDVRAAAAALPDMLEMEAPEATEPLEEEIAGSPEIETETEETA